MALSGFSSKLPVWYQLAMALRADILSGALMPGTQIEPEVQLAVRHGVSVMPVRQALRSLEAEGLISRQRGRGTFVSEHQRPASVTTSLASLYSRQFDKKAIISERGTVDVPPTFRDAFADQTTISFVQRLTFHDNRPWSFGTLYFLTEFNASITTPLLRRYPLYRVMEEECGVRLRRSHFSVRAAGASPLVARQLDVDPFSPVLSLTSVARDERGRAVGAYQMSFISDPCVLSFETAHGDIG